MLAILLCILPVTASAGLAATISPTVTVELTGNVPPVATNFSILLQGTDGAPMPEESTDGKKTIVITGAGTGQFGEIVYTRPGIYTYTMEQTRRNSSSYLYDNTVYQLTVQVTWSGELDGALEAVATLTKDNAEGKFDAAVYRNQYIVPPSDATIDDSSNSHTGTGSDNAAEGGTSGTGDGSHTGQIGGGSSGSGTNGSGGGTNGSGSNGSGVNGTGGVSGGAGSNASLSSAHNTNPNTGDDTHQDLWILLLLCSGAGMCVLAVPLFRKKRRIQ